MGKGNRRQKRIKMVLPVRISGKDSANKPINELAHTLDITPNGARLGGDWIPKPYEAVEA